MKQGAVTTLLVLGSIVLFYLACEGGYALARGWKPSLSLAFTLLERFDTEEPTAEALGAYLHTRNQLEERLPLLRRNGVVLGNTPYHKLANDDARVTLPDPVVGARFKPNLAVHSSLMRSRIFKPLDPVSYSYLERPGVELDAELLEFLGRYAIREVRWTTDENGYRTTLPASDAEKVVVLVGSSPCVGLFLRDEETLASLLQQRQPELRFVNACVNLTRVESHAAVAEELAERFGDRLVGLIYTLNEKNFETRAGGLRALARMAERLDELGVSYRVLIYFHYIYETMPDLFRKHRRLDQSFADKEAIFAASEALGFLNVDTYTMVRNYVKERASPGAGLALYADHGHFSREGTRRLAEELPLVAVTNPFATR